MIEWVGARQLADSQGHPTPTTKFIKISQNSKYMDKICTYFRLQVKQQATTGVFDFVLLLHCSAQICNKIL